jgi:hypothetical protein
MPYYGDLRKLLDEVRESGTAGLSGGETEHHRAGWRGTGWRGTGASVKTLLQRLKAKGLIVATKERRGFKGFGDVVYVAPEFARL